MQNIFIFTELKLFCFHRKCCGSTFSAGAWRGVAWLLMSDNTASVHTLGSCPHTAQPRCQWPMVTSRSLGGGEEAAGGRGGGGPGLCQALVCGVINGCLSEVTQTRTHCNTPHCTALHQPQHRSEANPTALPGSTKWRPSYTDHGDSRALTHRAHTSRGKQ